MADRDWAKKNPEKHAEKQRRWAEKNPEKVRESRRKWIEKNPELHLRISREYQARRRARLWEEMLEAYGRVCTCCGESNVKFLSLEHVGGLQGKPRKNVTTELVRLRDEGWPDTVTLFCFNCNLGSWRNAGICPHKDEANAIVEED